MNSIRELFLLDPEVIFLNHGSFGACPRTVFEIYQEWQKELEREPVEFLGRRAQELMATARERLAAYLNIDSGELVYFPNPTTAINMVVRSLSLEEGDEILTTNHEYGAMDRTWRFICKQTGARYIQQAIPLPVSTKEGIIEAVLSGVTPRTKILFISHITSPTALIFPVAEICRRAREIGLLTIVDGAHAPGQIPLDLSTTCADIYTGACHKWLCAPKGSAFLYASKKIQPLLDPLVVSWGYESEKPSGSQFIDFHEWQGTRDISAFLSVPTAIDFQQEHHWDLVREHCHALAAEARARIDALTGLEPICTDSSEWFAQMFSARLPSGVDVEMLKARLFEEFRVEAPLVQWQGEKFIRVSIQGYNDEKDVDVLLDALDTLLYK
jgi:isopenicillin-N epimerase